jgi:hypothetical protein
MAKLTVYDPVTHFPSRNAVQVLRAAQHVWAGIVLTEFFIISSRTVNHTIADLPHRDAVGQKTLEMQRAAEVFTGPHFT